jgi:hypothetical protein
MDDPMKTSQTRSRPLPSNEELLSQIRLLLDSFGSTIPIWMSWI